MQAQPYLTGEKCLHADSIFIGYFPLYTRFESLYSKMLASHRVYVIAELSS